MTFTLTINGQSRGFANLTPPVSLAEVIAELNLKGDRIAVEHNGDIVERARWSGTPVAAGDRLEIVHFVGGGAYNRGSAATMPVRSSGRCVARSVPARDRAGNSESKEAIFA